MNAKQLAKAYGVLPRALRILEHKIGIVKTVQKLRPAMLINNWLAKLLRHRTKTKVASPLSSESLVRLLHIIFRADSGHGVHEIPVRFREIDVDNLNIQR